MAPTNTLTNTNPLESIHSEWSHTCNYGAIFFYYLYIPSFVYESYGRRAIQASELIKRRKNRRIMRRLFVLPQKCAMQGNWIWILIHIHKRLACLLRCFGFFANIQEPTNDRPVFLIFFFSIFAHTKGELCADWIWYITTTATTTRSVSAH